MIFVYLECCTYGCERFQERREMVCAHILECHWPVT